MSLASTDLSPVTIYDTRLQKYVERRPLSEKDAWILRALKEGHLIVSATGVIHRRTWKHPANHGAGSYVKQTLSIHAKTGRVYFQLTFEGQTKSVLANRVVGLALIPNPENKPEVNHIDGDKQNNHVKNLEWATREEQEKHASGTGLKANRGSSNANAKLTSAQVEAIRAAKGTFTEIAKSFGVSRKTVKDIIDRKTWSHL